jgi:uncharacterized protein (TIGR00369 family)
MDEPLRDGAGMAVPPPSPEWAALFDDDPFCVMIGPIYAITLPDPAEPIRLGMWIEHRHCNKLGICHGGTLMAFLDNSLGYVAARALGTHTGGPTISVTMNFLAPARQGDWIESRVQIERSTRRMQFVRGHIVVDGQPITQATGIFVRPSS